MVSVTIRRKKLLQLLGPKAKLAEGQLEEAMGQIKAEVDAYDKQTDALSVEVTADRPDLFSVYGLARALRGWLEIESGEPRRKVGDKPALKIFAEREALQMRPVVVGAVVRGIQLDDEEIAELFQTQDKLDLTLGRKRKRISIGLYDLDQLKPPFHFKAMDARETKFKPLKAEKQMSLKQILEEHPTGREYAHLLEGRSKLPVLVDSSDEVLSLIPIINSVSSAVIPATRNLFIDHTGTDEHACNACLNILCQDFVDAGARVSKVEVVYPSKTCLTPHAAALQKIISLKHANKALGLQFSAKQAVGYLQKQRITAKAVSGDKIACRIPAYRSDFLHWVDLAEEIAIAHGFNNFEPHPPTTFTRGALAEQTLKENFVRDFMLGAGFTELSTYAVTNEEKVRRAKSDEQLVEILNPVSDKYAALRSTLLPNLLEVLSENTHEPYPQKIFELGEVAAHNPRLAEKVETKIHLCCVSCHGQASLTEVASVLNEFAKRIGAKVVFKKLEGPQFISGRSALVEDGVSGKAIGRMGELHPEVLAGFGLEVPAAAFEVEVGT